MQVIKTESSGFKPIDLTIKITTHEEYVLLKEVFGYDISIPDKLCAGDFINEKQRSLLSKLFVNAYQVLIK